MNRLKELRKRRGLTLAELKDKIKDKQGVSFSTSQLSSYENGKRSPRNESAWEAIADYFGVSVGYLLGYDSDLKNEADIKVAVLDESIEKLCVIKDNMILRESDEGPNLLDLGLVTAIAAIESFKKEIEEQELGGE
ncbi:helix-turn-helix domain-containing protein [Streptococcus macedonicus]|uniref:helix-turn-helix domain-containing protein n=1 Tax=Streptococcus macedonicus TaxID=59310 RepID=UPI0022E874B2|nr:helix-turn-helix transcriptional regulator [Streptococcus macedonicus]